MTTTAQAQTPQAQTVTEHFMEFETAHREAKQWAAVLMQHFDALADKAGCNEKDEANMFAAFGFEQMSREILRSLDQMLWHAEAIRRQGGGA